MESKAIQEKVFRGETTVLYVRFLVVVLSTVVYVPFIRSRPTTITWLGDLSLTAVWIYVIYVWLFKPYLKHPALTSSYFTSVSDAIGITLGILATGSFASPFFVDYYGAVLAIGLRYSYRETMLASGFYAVSYLALIVMAGQVMEDPGSLIMRLGFIPIIGFYGARFARETMSQTIERHRYQEVAERLDLEAKEHARAEAKLREQRDAYQTLLDTQSEMGEGVVVAELPSGRITYTNNAFLNISGYSESDLMSMPSYLNLVAPEDLPVLKERLSRRLQGEEVPPRTELAIIHKDGHHIDVEAAAMEQIVEEKKQLMTIVRDITERRRAEKKLASTMRQLERSNVDLEDFAYVVSHDLQSPLNTMVSFVRLLENRYKGQLDDRADEYIDYVVQGGQRMGTMINDLLTYSRVGTRGEPFKPVDLESVLKLVLGQLEAAISESRAAITHDPLPSIPGDYSQLARLFQNLIGNAIKFRGEEPPRIHISGEQRDNEWQFWVRDNGIGIEPKYTERIFGVFQRLHRQEEYSGTGIGLAVCKRIVERHGGRIWVESMPGEGSTFYFTIPGGEST